MHLPEIQPFRKFTDAENATWATLFARQAPGRKSQIYHIFDEGVRELELEADRVPDLDRINKYLKIKTGFIGVPVTGHEDPRSFFPMLARGEFPIGNFIRDQQDINYTPAPDVFHDLYGHLPFYANAEYANFGRRFGELGSKYVNEPALLRQWERLFWFTCEFALIETSAGRRIFGAGIASSFGECAYALSEEHGPEVVPFDIEAIRHQEFRIDEMQKKLFLLKNTQQLYDCLDEFDAGVM